MLTPKWNWFKWQPNGSLILGNNVTHSWPQQLKHAAMTSSCGDRTTFFFSFEECCLRTAMAPNAFGYEGFLFIKSSYFFFHLFSIRKTLLFGACVCQSSPLFFFIKFNSHLNVNHGRHDIWFLIERLHSLHQNSISPKSNKTIRLWCQKPISRQRSHLSQKN